MNKETRYTIDSKDRIRQWQCWAGEKEGKYGIFYTDGLLNGKMKDPIFKESKPKNVGRANATTAQEQSVVDCENAVGRKETANYFATPELAKSNKLFLPMLAHKFEKYRDKISYPVISQPKLDGARCNIYWCDLKNKVVARTRTGKDYSAVCDHVVGELKEICETNKMLVFDGELYNHNLKNDFEQLMSLSRQLKPTAKDIDKAKSNLQYYVYDVCLKNDTEARFNQRNDFMQHLNKTQDFDMVIFSEFNVVKDEITLDLLEEQYLKEGYEGQMVRVPSSCYKIDGRSADLLKKKQFTDDEFEIVEVVEGEAAWKGCAKQIVIRLPDGRTQGCGIDGSFAVNKERYENRSDLIGKMATVRYFRFTKDNFLYIPVCKDINRHD